MTHWSLQAEKIAPQAWKFVTSNVDDLALKTTGIVAQETTKQLLR